MYVFCFAYLETIFCWKLIGSITVSRAQETQSSDHPAFQRAVPVTLEGASVFPGELVKMPITEQMTKISGSASSGEAENFDFK